LSVYGGHRRPYSFLRRAIPALYGYNEIPMERPLDFITLKSKFQRPIYLSFEVVLSDDVLHVEFTDIPKNDSPWICHYRSTKHGEKLIPLKGVGEVSEATSEEVAKVLCKKINVQESGKINNIQTNCVDLYIPEFNKLGPVYPNYPEMDSDVTRVKGYVLFADLRGFSNWSMHAEPEQIHELYKVMSDIIVEYPTDYLINYWKLLGDGIMLVWEVDKSELDTANCAIGAAYELHKKYWYYRKDSLHQIPEGFGIAVCGGYLTKFRSVTFFESCVVSDYLGPVVNQASRLQRLAKAGEVLVNRRAEKAANGDWYSFINVSDDMKSEIASLEGLSPYEREVFKVCHKYFGPTWKNFIKTPT
jgi:class 3 adenylate cyclase